MFINDFPRSLLAALIIVGQLTACDSISSQSEIQLSPAGGGHWKVSYRLPSPATAIALVRTTDDARIQRWQVASPDFEIVQIDKKDVVRRKDSAAFSKVDILVPATYVVLPKDYAPFSPFSDGGLLIHSGRFQYCSSTKFEAGDTCDGPWSMRLAPPDEAHVLLHGEVHDGPVEWLDSDDGTKVYVGTAKPMESPHFVAVVDPALPTPIGKLLTDLLPRLIEQYAQVLPPLRHRPTLFVSYDPSFGNGHGRQGGTLPGQIFMHFYGPGWLDPRVDGQSPEDTAWFFAHEVGHLFQHDVTGELEASWIHEGSAETFAYLVLDSLGSVPKDYLALRRDRALSGCRDAIQSGPLESAASRGRFSDYYNCGLIMFLGIDSAIRTSSMEESDLFDFWTNLIADTSEGSVWQNESFLKYSHPTLDHSQIELLRSLIIERQGDPATALVLLDQM